MASKTLLVAVAFVFVTAAGALAQDTARMEQVIQSHVSAGTFMGTVLVALGRVANVDGLHLHSAGIALTSRGHIQVDDTLQTNVPGLYVAGATASGRFTSRIFIENGRFHGEAILKSINAGGCTP